MERLLALGRDMRKALLPFGSARADWEHGTATLGTSLTEHPLRNVGLAARSWRTLLPSVAARAVAGVFLDHGASAWVLRTNQVGGTTRTSPPSCPTSSPSDNHPASVPEEHGYARRPWASAPAEEHALAPGPCPRGDAPSEEHALAQRAARSGQTPCDPQRRRGVHACEGRRPRPEGSSLERGDARDRSAPTVRSPLPPSLGRQGGSLLGQRPLAAVAGVQRRGRRESVRSGQWPRQSAPLGGAPPPEARAKARPSGGAPPLRHRAKARPSDAPPDHARGPRAYPCSSGRPPTRCGACSPGGGSPTIRAMLEMLGEGRPFPGLLTDLYHPDAAYVAWRLAATGSPPSTSTPAGRRSAGPTCSSPGWRRRSPSCARFRYSESDLRYLRPGARLRSGVPRGAASGALHGRDPGHAGGLHRLPP